MGSGSILTGIAWIGIIIYRGPDSPKTTFAAIMRSMNDSIATTGNALIVGGGIAGLTAAICLQARGWQVTVLEQASEYQEVGAGLQLSPNACKVFARLGLLNRLRAMAFEPQALEMRIGHSGRQIFRVGLGGRTRQRWQQDYLHLHRADLLAVLVRELENRSVDLRRNAKAVRYESLPNSITVQLEDSNVIHADLLIGADGIHSTLREQMFGPDEPRFTGNVAWRAVVPTARLADLAPPPTACVWTGSGRHAVTYQLRGGELCNFVGVVEQDTWSEESWTAIGSREQALADFAGFHPTIQKLLDNAETLHRWALFDRPPLARWSTDRAVLIGDACHPMLPFLAQGAAQGIEDAWMLAEAVESARLGKLPLTAALENFYQQRSLRTTAVQAASGATQRRFHRRAICYWPLIWVARLWPNAILRRFDWLYAYDPTAAHANE